MQCWTLPSPVHEGYTGPSPAPPASSLHPAMLCAGLSSCMHGLTCAWCSSTAPQDSHEHALPSAPHLLSLIALVMYIRHRQLHSLCEQAKPYPLGGMELPSSLCSSKEASHHQRALPLLCYSPQASRRSMKLGSPVRGPDPVLLPRQLGRRCHQLTGFARHG